MVTVEEVRERLKTDENDAATNIRGMAARDFEDHKITELSKPGDYARVFRCAREDTGFYGFKVAVWPYYLSVNGEVGDLTLCIAEDMIEWCRSAIKSPGYFFEKAVPRSSVRKVVSELKFARWLRDQKANYSEEWSDEKLLQCYELFECGDPDSVSRITDFLMEEMGDCDAWEYGDLFKDYESNLWWSLEAIRKFLELYDAMIPVDPVDTKSDQCHEDGYKLAEKDAKRVGVCVVCGGPGACCKRCF